MGGALTDMSLQKNLLEALKQVINNVKQLMQAAKSTMANPEDLTNGQMVTSVSRQLAESLTVLRETSRGVIKPPAEDEAKKQAAEELQRKLKEEEQKREEK